MKKILFVVLCILAFAGGLTTIYFTKNNMETKEVAKAYDEYTAMLVDTSQFNDEEYAQLATLRATIETAKADKKLDALQAGITSIQGLVQTHQDRLANEANQAYENLVQSLHELGLPEVANDWERGEFERIRGEAQGLIDSGATQEEIVAKITELHTFANSVHEWIAAEGGRGTADAVAENPDEAAYEEPVE